MLDVLDGLDVEFAPDFLSLLEVFVFFHELEKLDHSFSEVIHWDCTVLVEVELHPVVLDHNFDIVIVGVDVVEHLCLVLLDDADKECDVFRTWIVYHDEVFSKWEIDLVVHELVKFETLAFKILKFFVVTNVGVCEWVDACLFEGAIPFLSLM